LFQFSRVLFYQKQTTNVVYDRNQLVKRKELYARMRTLLNESLPPNFDGGPSFSRPQKIQRLPRTFSESAVLSNSEPMEVGVDEAVIATPGADAVQANSASARGLTIVETEVEQLKEAPAL
jgi:hypothetical protein